MDGCVVMIVLESVNIPSVVVRSNPLFKKAPSIRERVANTISTSNVSEEPHYFDNEDMYVIVLHYLL